MKCRRLTPLPWKAHAEDVHSGWKLLDMQVRVKLAPARTVYVALPSSRCRPDVSTCTTAPTTKLGVSRNSRTTLPDERTEIRKLARPRIT